MNENDHKSPIDCLIYYISDSPFQVAPERKKEFLKLRNKHKFLIKYEESYQDYHITINLSNNHISFGIPAAERLWAYSYAYFAVITAVQEQQSKSRDIDLHATEEIRNAMCLLQWANNCEINKKHTNWPNNLPKPVYPCELGTLEYGANELFLMMTGWILLHEIGHVVCNHDYTNIISKENSISQENEADCWASDWMLNNWKSFEGNDARIFAQRSTGIAIALSIIASIEIYKRTRGNNTHPDPPDRLFNFLIKYVPKTGSKGNSYDFAWFVAILILKLHFEKMGIEMKTEVGFTNAPECVSEMLQILKRHDTK